jgi:hypothetical protein
VLAIVTAALIASGSGALELPAVWHGRPWAAKVASDGAFIGTVAVVHAALVVVGAYLILLCSAAVLACLFSLVLRCPGLAHPHFLVRISLPGTRWIVAWTVGLAAMSGPLVSATPSLAATVGGTSAPTMIRVGPGVVPSGPPPLGGAASAGTSSASSSSVSVAEPSTSTPAVSTPAAPTGTAPASTAPTAPTATTQPIPTKTLTTAPTMSLIPPTEYPTPATAPAGKARGAAGVIPPASSQPGPVPTTVPASRAGQTPDPTAPSSPAATTPVTTPVSSGSGPPSVAVAAPKATLPAVSEAPANPASSVTAPGETARGETATPTPTSSGTWQVAPGDHLWSIASATLTAAWGYTPSVSDIGSYWWQVVTANRASLPNPADIDLLFAGDVVTLPPVPPAPTGPAVSPGGPT